MDPQDYNPNEWDDYSPGQWTDVPTKKNETSDSLISKLWKSISEPIPAVKKFANDTADALSRTANEPGIMSTLKGFAGGALQGISDLATPLNLTTAALGGAEYGAGKAGLSSIAKLASMGGKLSGVPTAIHGGSQIIDPNTSLSEKAVGLGEVAGGTLPFLHTPKIGSIADSISSKEPTNFIPAGSNFDNAPKELTDRLNILRDKARDGSLTGDELIEAKQLDSKIRRGEYNITSPESKATENPTLQEYLNNWKIVKNPPNPSQEIIGKVDESVKPNIKLIPNEPNSIVVKNPDPGVIKQVMQGGYVFDSIRDDGTFKMVKSDKPVDLPVLEQEVGNNRPTPSNSARMMAGGVSKAEEAKKPSVMAEIFNFPRAVMASMDFSAPLRQGLPLIHKKQFWTSLDDMFKAWGSEKAYQAIQSDILDRPLFKPRMSPDGNAVKSFAEEAGLKLTDLKSLSNREESLMSSWSEKVPGVRPSNRAYTVFLNKLRADTFESLINNAGVLTDAKANLPLARELANFVNTASGRGSLGKLEKSAVTLNSLLFSPRLISSRLTMLNPRYYIMANPVVRKEALKSLFAVAAAGNTVTQLGKLAGGTVESDPASSDFGKLKIGNVRLDPYAGFQQYIVAANRLLTQREVSSTSGKEYDLSNPKGPYDPTNLNVLGNFARGKLHPVLGFAWSLLNGQKEMTGQKMNFTTPNPMDNAVMQRFTPILFQDLYSIAQEDPTLLPIMGTLSAFGMGTQVYGGNQ